MKWLLTLTLLVWAESISSQELTIFDLNDFVDPRSQGATVTSNRSILCPCTELLAIRAMTGWDHNYVNVTAPTQIDIAFAHLAMSYYRGPWQWNAKFSALRSVSIPASLERFAHRTLPRHSLTLQLSRYTASKADEAGIGRTQLTWRISHYAQPSRNLEQGTWTADKLHHEFGLEYDIPGNRGSLGSLAYTLIGGENPRIAWKKKPSRLAYVFRLRGREIGPASVDGGISVGVLGHSLNFGHFRQLTIQPNVRISIPVASTGVNMHLRLAPTWQRLPDSPDGDYRWKLTPEVALFADRLFSFSRLHVPRPAD